MSKPVTTAAAEVLTTGPVEKYTPIRIVTSDIESLSRVTQQELDRIAEVLDSKAGRLDDERNININSSNILIVDNNDLLAAIIEFENIAPWFILHITFDLEPYGSGLYYFDQVRDGLVKINTYPNNAVFNLPVYTDIAAVPAEPADGEMVMITGQTPDTDDGIYVWWPDKTAGAGWMKLDWSNPSFTPPLWVDYDVGMADFNIQSSDATAQPGQPPHYDANGSGGTNSTGSVINAWNSGDLFAVTNNRTNRTVTVDFSAVTADPDVVLAPAESGTWRYNGVTFDRVTQ